MQAKFCREYVIDLNGTQAAIRAGYSEKGASVQGSELLAISKVKAEVDRLIAARSKATELTAIDVVRELAMLAFSDIRKVFNENGKLKPIHEWDTASAHAVASIEVEELFEGSGRERAQVGYTTKVKFWDKNKALEMLGRHKAMFNDTLKHDVGGKLEELIAASRKDIDDDKKLVTSSS